MSIRWHFQIKSMAIENDVGFNQNLASMYQDQTTINSLSILAFCQVRIYAFFTHTK